MRPDQQRKAWEKAQRERKAAYEEYISSPEWRVLRIAAIKRARGRCERCDCEPPSFEVHHLTYERFGGKERPGDLQALCTPCHRSVHGHGDSSSPEINRKALTRIQRKRKRKEWIEQGMPVVKRVEPAWKPAATLADGWKADRMKRKKD